MHDLRKAATICNTTKANPLYHYVQVTDKHFIGLDGCSLVKIDRNVADFVGDVEAGKDKVLSAIEIKKHKDDFTFFTLQGHTLASKFPEYTRACPTGEPVFSIKVDAKRLAKMLKLFETKHGANDVMLSFYGDDKAIKIDGDNSENKHIVGLVMPLRK